MTNSISATSRLDSLLPELLTNVVAFVRAAEDLKSLCLTSSLLGTIATLSLYREVKLTEKTPGWPLQPGTAILSARNRGIPAIRHLSIHIDSEEHRRAGTLLVQRLLALLPRNKLESLQTFDVPMDEVTVSLLFTQQRKLQQLCLGPLEFDCVPLLSSAFFHQDLWSNLRTIMVVPQIIRNIDDLRAHQYMIQHSTKLNHLCIGTCVTTDPDYGDSLQDSATGEGDLLPVLFSHLKDNPEQMLRLNILYLSNVSLVTPTITLTAAIDFSKLTQLDIESCSGYENLLTSLAKGFHHGPCAIRSFSLNAEGLAGEVLFDFLTSFTGLERLYLAVSQAINDFDTSCLYEHRKTLTEFVLVGEELCACQGVTGIRGLVVPTIRFASKCPELEYLGLMLPGVQTGALDPTARERFDNALTQILALPKMRLLRIYSWPVFHRNFAKDADAENKAVYSRALDDFMASLFMRLTARGIQKFPTVCFGGESWSYACDGVLSFDTAIVGYTHSDQRSVFGEMFTEAMRSTYAELKQAFPDHNLLRFV